MGTDFTGGGYGGDRGVENHFHRSTLKFESEEVSCKVLGVRLEQEQRHKVPRKMY